MLPIFAQVPTETITEIIAKQGVAVGMLVVILTIMGWWLKPLVERDFTNREMMMKSLAESQMVIAEAQRETSKRLDAHQFDLKANSEAMKANTAAIDKLAVEVRGACKHPIAGHT